MHLTISKTNKEKNCIFHLLQTDNKLKNNNNNSFKIQLLTRRAHITH